MTGHPDPDDVAIVVRGIDLAVWNLPQVAAWADSHISAADAAPSWLLECSLSKHILDARRALLTVASASHLLADDDLALALVGRRLMSGAITPREATRAAFAVVRGQTTGSLVDAVYHLDDGFDLADARIVGTADEVQREAMRFFGETVQQTAGGARLREFLQAEGRLLEGHGAAEQGVEADEA